MKARMTIMDFISIRDQQNFEDDAEINPIEIKIENDKIQKKPVRFTLKGLLFSSAIENDTEKIFVITSGLMDAKYNLIKGKLYQTIGIVNLKEMLNWNKIKKSLRWLNVNVQAHGNNKDAKHFS